METLQTYGTAASQYAFELLGDRPLDLTANRMNEALYDSFAVPG